MGPIIEQFATAEERLEAAQRVYLQNREQEGAALAIAKILLPFPECASRRAIEARVKELLGVW